MSLKSAVEDFFALIDGDGYSSEQYEDALKSIRKEAGVRDPFAPGAEPKESDS